MTAFGGFPVNAAFTAVLGGAMAGYGFASRSEARAMQRWPCVTGTISASTVEEYYDRGSAGDFDHQRLFRPNISYDFFVGDREYRGHRIEVGSVGASWRSHAESVVARYPVGKQVTVYYDPANPSECLLEPATAPAWAAAATAIGLLIALAALGWMALVKFGVIDG